jgi:hypothetical protein
MVVSTALRREILSLGCGSRRIGGDVSVVSDDGRALFTSQDAEVPVEAGKLG